MSHIGLLDGLAAQMKYLNKREQVLSENIANADTAGYHSRDLTAPNFSQILGEMSNGTIARPTVSATSRMSELGSSVGVGNGRVVQVKGGEEKSNGNNVVMEDELLKMGSIKQDYSAAASLYKKSIGLLNIVTTGKE